MVVKDPTDDAAHRVLTFKSSTSKDAAGSRIVAPPAGSSGDPTNVGAQLVVYRADGGKPATIIDLAASGWTRKVGAGRTQYVYKGSKTDSVRRSCSRAT